MNIELELWDFELAKLKHMGNGNIATAVNIIIHKHIKPDYDNKTVQEISSANMFLDEDIEKGDDPKEYMCKALDLFNSYIEYCKENRLCALGRNKFYLLIEDRGFSINKYGKGGGALKVFGGSLVWGE